MLSNPGKAAGLVELGQFDSHSVHIDWQTWKEPESHFQGQNQGLLGRGSSTPH